MHNSNHGFEDGDELAPVVPAVPVAPVVAVVDDNDVGRVVDQVLPVEVEVVADDVLVEVKELVALADADGEDEVAVTPVVVVPQVLKTLGFQTSHRTENYL